jgi:hypothetical protein
VRACEQTPEALADFEIKLARYDCAMRSVIYHPLGLEFFTRFLEKARPRVQARAQVGVGGLTRRGAGALDGEHPSVARRA